MHALQGEALERQRSYPSERTLDVQSHGAKGAQALGRYLSKIPKSTFGPKYAESTKPKENMTPPMPFPQSQLSCSVMIVNEQSLLKKKKKKEDRKSLTSNLYQRSGHSFFLPPTKAPFSIFDFLRKKYIENILKIITECSGFFTEQLKM